MKPVLPLLVLIWVAMPAKAQSVDFYGKEVAKVFVTNMG